MATTDTLFRGIASDTHRRLDAERRPDHFDAGEDLLVWGQRVHRLHEIVRGRTKVWRPGIDGNAIVLYFLNAGEAAGLMSACRGVPGVATITAVQPTETHSWPAALIEELLHKDAAMADNALQIVARRAEILADRVEDLASARADQQLARALLRLAGEDGDWSRQGEATVPITRQDLADMTRSTLHTASRTLSGWEARHLVRSRRGRVTITDPAALADIAGLAD